MFQGEGNSRTSFISYYIERGYVTNQQTEANLKYAAGTMFGGGADTVGFDQCIHSLSIGTEALPSPLPL